MDLGSMRALPLPRLQRPAAPARWPVGVGRAPCPPVGAAPLAPPPAVFSQRSSSSSRLSIIAAGQANSSLSLPLDRSLDTPLDGFDSIADALAALARGEFLVVLDDEDRENEGDLILAGDKATPESMAFLVEHSSGVVCLSMEGKDLDRLRLPLMVSSAQNEEAMSTAFAITVDLKAGVSTGISAADRAATIKRLSDPTSQPEEFNRPGHIFPLRYRPGGVLVRPGHTEAAVDLARMAGCYPAGVLCEIVSRKDGSMARTPELLAFAKQHGLKCITIADLVRYRMAHEQLVRHSAAATLSTRYGQLTAHSFTSDVDGCEHMVLVAGSVEQQEGVLTYVLPDRGVADLLGAAGPGPSSLSLDAALQHVTAAGSGVVVYMRQPTPKGGGLSAELRGLAASSGAAASSSRGSSDSKQDAFGMRQLGVAAQMLSALGVRSVALRGDMELVQGMRSCGLSVSHAGSNGVHLSPAGHSLANGAHHREAAVAR